MKNKYFEDQFGITLPTYQSRARLCVENFLAQFPKNETSQSLKIFEETDCPFRVRVCENPPSAQIWKLPQGGLSAGINRIRAKLAAFTALEIAQQEDLTRECIILTLKNIALDEILFSGLISPSQTAEFLQNLRRGAPDFFIVLQRYLMGIEEKDKMKIPYGIVAANDEKTFEFLETLPLKIL